MPSLSDLFGTDTGDYSEVSDPQNIAMFGNPLWNADNANMFDGFTDMSHNGSDSEFNLTNKYNDWYDQGNRFYQGSALGGGLGAGAFDSNGKLMGDFHRWTDQAPEFGLAVNAAIGAGTAGLGGGFGLGSGIAGSAANGAVGGALGSAATGGDPFKGALAGGVGGGIVGANPAGSLGLLGTTGNILNKATGAAGAALATGGNPLQAGLRSAITGSTNAGLNYAGNQLGSLFDGSKDMGFSNWGTDQGGDYSFDGTPETTGAGSYVNPLNGATNQSYAPQSFMGQPGIYDALGVTNAPPQTTGASYAAPDFMNPVGGQQPQQQKNPFKEMIKSALMSNPTNPTSGVGSLVSSLAGLYSGYQQRKRFGGLAGDLQSLYGPNSAYSQQLRQQLDRRDAAAGRRSQYGPREVELQAKLADMNSRNAPELAKIYGQQNAGTNEMLQNLIRLGNSSGAFKSLADYFLQGQ